MTADQESRAKGIVNRPLSIIGRALRFEIKPVMATALVAVMAVACSASPTKLDTVQQHKRDTPIGTILRQYATQRSLEQCKIDSVSDEKCGKALENAEQHLDGVNARIEALLTDPKTNMCDLVRFAGSCNNPNYTLGDLADCLQVSADRGEALNSRRFVLKLDSHKCPTDAKY